ncbi:ABC transporter ATP-binding protein [Pleionea sp. CnH1-48]|uniref:ABC transporter ATP-binding protein n=1 Tax=Pleionea sp. CnH1-48 TaxID=2954494 RepID=UPI002097D3F7|nr:ATP-binding cassette domain-containing protein [Pleionea sp. CnH1-48]MCO7225429.1 ATP-binding cassette domain-containing protein [Pleionea sp. CnH1-48]
MIEVKALSKTFKFDKVALKERQKKKEAAQDPREDGAKFHAVRDVSFSCESGKVLGLLGPNGAGKTTTLRMLSTALQPTSGEILIDGEDVVAHPLVMRKKIGFLSGKTALYRRLSVRENVEYFGRLHGMQEDHLQSEIDRLFDILNINSFEHKKAEDLSTGMAQRANIARTVIHQPRVLILDEPTTGLDVVAAKIIMDFIESYRGSETSVIFSTHHLHEVEQLCDRVTVINEGIASFSGLIDEFRAHDESGNLYNAFLKLIDAA